MVRTNCTNLLYNLKQNVYKLKQKRERKKLKIKTPWKLKTPQHTFAERMFLEQRTSKFVLSSMPLAVNLDRKDTATVLQKSWSKKPEVTPKIWSNTSFLKSWSHIKNRLLPNKFSIYLTGFRKNHGTHRALLKMIETWKTKLNMSHKVGVIYIDLSKTFNIVNHELWTRPTCS